MRTQAVTTVRICLRMVGKTGKNRNFHDQVQSENGSLKEEVGSIACHIRYPKRQQGGDETVTRRIATEHGNFVTFSNRRQAADGKDGNLCGCFVYHKWK